MPGVLAVVTAADLPQPVARFGVSHQDRPVLADGRVTFHGEPVAAVVAETLDQAQAAAQAVEVTFEEVEGVFDLDDALAPDAPLVQDPSVRPEKDELKHTNVLGTALYEWGDADAAAQDSAVVVEHVYHFPMVTHFPIEPGGTVVVPTEDGGLEVYSPVQHPYLLQRTIAKVLALPLAKVRVVAPDPGGGFGGKQNPKLEPLVAFLAQMTGRTCRLVLSLEQTFQMMRRAACRVRRAPASRPRAGWSSTTWSATTSSARTPTSHRG